jgi:Na+-driven multidrug efflux pump
MANQLFFYQYNRQLNFRCAEMNSQFSTQKEVKPYREVLRVSLPLVVSMSSTMIMEFTDRIFLAN